MDCPVKVVPHELRRSCKDPKSTSRAWRTDKKRRAPAKPGAPLDTVTTYEATSAIVKPALCDKRFRKPGREMTMEIGLCGTGRMGAAIVQRLMDHGHRMTVWNRNVAKVAPLLERGAR